MFCADAGDGLGSCFETRTKTKNRHHIRGAVRVPLILRKQLCFVKNRFCKKYNNLNFATLCVEMDATMPADRYRSV